MICGSVSPAWGATEPSTGETSRCGRCCSCKEGELCKEMSVTVWREDVSAYLRRFSVISSVLKTPADSVQLLPDLPLLYCTHIWTQFKTIKTDVLESHRENNS